MQKLAAMQLWQQVCEIPGNAGTNSFSILLGHDWQYLLLVASTSLYEQCAVKMMKNVYRVFYQQLKIAYS